MASTRSALPQSSPGRAGPRMYNWWDVCDPKWSFAKQSSISEPLSVRLCKLVPELSKGRDLPNQRPRTVLAGIDAMRMLSQARDETGSGSRASRPLPAELLRDLQQPHSPHSESSLSTPKRAESPAPTPEPKAAAAAAAESELPAPAIETSAVRRVNELSESIGPADTPRSVARLADDSEEEEILRKLLVSSDQPEEEDDMGEVDLDDDESDDDEPVAVTKPATAAAAAAAAAPSAAAASSAPQPERSDSQDIEFLLAEQEAAIQRELWQLEHEMEEYTEELELDETAIAKATAPSPAAAATASPPSKPATSTPAAAPVAAPAAAPVAAPAVSPAKAATRTAAPAASPAASTANAAAAARAPVATAQPAPAQSSTLAAKTREDLKRVDTLLEEVELEFTEVMIVDQWTELRSIIKSLLK